MIFARIISFFLCFLCAAVQAQPQPQLRATTFVTTEMDRLSRQLEKNGELKEFAGARTVKSRSGYLLVTTTMGYVGGNGIEQYFALFSIGAGETPPAFVGWAMLPEWLQFGAQQPFSLRASNGGEKILRLTLIDNSREPPSQGKPHIEDYVIPVREEWGSRLAAGH